MNTKLVKEKIEHFEYWNNGLHGLSGADVKVVNVHVGKVKATADVIVTECDLVERFNNCVYPLVELGL